MNLPLAIVVIGLVWMLAKDVGKVLAKSSRVLLVSLWSIVLIWLRLGCLTFTIYVLPRLTDLMGI